MDILVLMKQVPADLSHVTLTGDHTIDRTSGGPSTNPVDKNALEAAVQLKEGAGGTVTALTVGPAKANAVLKEAAAVGADAGVRVTDDAIVGSDALATARVLAAAVRALSAEKSADLIIAGRQSFDGASAAVPAMVAELLGWTQVTNVSAVEAAGNGVVECRQTHPYGTVRVRATLPAVITVDEYINTPRYPSVKSKLAANKVKFEVLDAAALGVDAVGAGAARTRVLTAEAPPARAAGTRIEGDTAQDQATNLVAALAAANVI